MDKQRRDLYQREYAEWTDAELAHELTEAYQASRVPPCRLCGKPLEMQAIGGGSTVWACNGATPEMRVDMDHYSRSRWEDYRCGGDERVIEALHRWSNASLGSQQPTESDPAIVRKQGEPGAAVPVKGDRK